MTQELQSSTGGSASSDRGLHIGLWVAQALLAVGFGMAGLMKLTTPYQQLVSTQAWAQSMPEALIRFIGLSEVAGTLGVILPAATRIRPILTPIAAVGLVIIMILAALVHLKPREPPSGNGILVYPGKGEDATNDLALGDDLAGCCARAFWMFGFGWAHEQPTKGCFHQPANQRRWRHWHDAASGL